MFAINKGCKAIVFFAVFALSGCAKLSPDPKDPFEKVNRVVYGFNTVVDKLYIKPAAMFYDLITPIPIKTSVGNFFNNIGEVPNIFNDILQLKFGMAANDFARLAINSTFGVVGMFDVASNIGLPKHDQDFGLTMQYWGYKSSSYLVLPILGPSTFRDTLALPINTATNPAYYLEPKWRNRYIIGTTVHKRSELEHIVDVVTAAGVDKYVMVRNAYLQRRDHLKQSGSSDGEAAKAELLGEPPE